jgi:hypothetical protein
MAQYLTVIENEDGFTLIIEEGFKLLFVILCRVGLEQIRAYYMMYHVYLMQQSNDSLYVSFFSFSNHSIFETTGKGSDNHGIFAKFAAKISIVYQVTPKNYSYYANFHLLSHA